MKERYQRALDLYSRGKLDETTLRDLSARLRHRQEAIPTQLDTLQGPLQVDFEIDAARLHEFVADIERWMHEGDIVRRKTFLRVVYREMRLWPRIGEKPWTRKVLVVAHLEELTRAVMVAPRGLADSTFLIRFYGLLQAYASLQFRPLGRWKLKIERSS